VLYLKSLDEKFPHVAMIYDKFNGGAKAYGVIYDASHVRTIELHLWYPPSRHVLRPGDVFEAEYYVVITFTDYVPGSIDEVQACLKVYLHPPHKLKQNGLRT